MEAIMEFAFTEAEKAYQQELRSFLEKEMNESIVQEVESLQGLGENGKKLLGKMGDQRILAPSWPEKYGGRGLGQVAQGILFEEMGYYQAPWPIDALMVGPTLMRYGTEEQKDRFLFGMGTGKIEIALGYTEPDAGSDLASLRLEAVEKEDHYLLNGQKVFNTESHYSDYHWLLARTDTSVPKHKGLSIFLVDLKSPGVTIRPMHTSAGLRTNEVFYDNVKVPKNNLVGEKNSGWKYAASALGAERIMWTGDIQKRFDQFLVYLKNEVGLDRLKKAKPWAMDKLASIRAKLHTARLTGFKAAAMHDGGKNITYEASLVKLFVSETRVEFFKLVMEILGLYGQLSKRSAGAPINGIMLQEYLDASRWTIIGGTSEIQRQIIALAGCHLPRK